MHPKMSASEPVSGCRAAVGAIWCRVRARVGPRRGDERGAAISLWVVLMVPVSAFAAVVAMAGPQRFAAESTMQDAADDLAMFAVAWREGHNTPTGQLRAFPPECSVRTKQEEADLDALEGDIIALSTSDPEYDIKVVQLNARLDAQLTLFEMRLPLSPPATGGELLVQVEDLKKQLIGWEEACVALSDALVRDLGNLGVDVDSLRGFYSDSLTQSTMTTASCSAPLHTTEAGCTVAGEVWTPVSPGFDLPCWTFEQTVVVRDAVHVALTGRWQDAGWAAAQVWPDGMAMAAESMGRLSLRDFASTAPECGDQLVVFNEQGQPVWAGTETAPDSRKLTQSVGRTPLSG